MGVRTRASLGFVAVALACLYVADLEVATVDAWGELGRLVVGLVTPDFSSLGSVAAAVARTLAFAFVGVALGAVAGFLLALVFRHALVRAACAFLRAIHELFWALIFLQFFGLHPLTGVLAIGIPFAGIFAKVYYEILEEANPLPLHALSTRTGTLSAFLYARIPDAMPHLRSYTAYRLECGLRSSAILGFVGIPTLGFYLESSFAQGLYSEVGGLLLLFYALIATLRFWARPALLPLYLAAAPFFLGNGLPIALENIGRFFTVDIVPAPLRAGEGLVSLGRWLADLLATQAIPGIWATLVLTQIALVMTAILALVTFPLASRNFTGRIGGMFGHLLLVIGRSTPEYLLAFILLQLWGPSMLPAVVALALHNGSVVAHLLGRRSDELNLRPDTPRGINRYAYEVVPRIYGPFLALVFYRWEIIMRETAILGILGIATLGFYVDSAIQDIHFDRAMVLILVTALLNIGVDAFARRLRDQLRLRSTPTQLAVDQSPAISVPSLAQRC